MRKKKDKVIGEILVGENEEPYLQFEKDGFPIPINDIKEIKKITVVNPKEKIINNRRSVSAILVTWRSQHQEKDERWVFRILE